METDARPTIKLPNCIIRPYQEEVWDALRSGKKRVYGVWHRRSGKSEIAMHWTVLAAHQRPGNYLICFPAYDHVRRAIWDSINPHTGQRRIFEACPPSLIRKVREDEMAIALKVGSEIRFAGSDSYDALMGGSYAGVVFDEWALADPLAWAYLKPILEENDGWALFTTTPRGSDHAKTMWDEVADDPRWLRSFRTVEETGIFSPQQLLEQHREYVQLYGPEEGEAMYRQEMYCDFSVPISGSYYGTMIRQLEAEGKITRLPYDPNLPCDTTWDCGYGDATAIWWVQPNRITGEYRFIDHYEVRRQGPTDIAKAVLRKPYPVRAHYLPADAKAGHLAASGKTVASQLERLGVTPQYFGKGNADYDQQIQAVRSILPLCLFDKLKCHVGLEALKGYHSAYKTARRSYSINPVHDWASHSATAVAVYALFKLEDKILQKGITTVERPFRDGGGSSSWMR